MLPNLLVIGAAKAGTTSFWDYLNQHPQIFMSPGKELHFFDLDSNWVRGVDWYAAQFVGGEGYPVVGEATPGYTRFPHRPEAALRAVKLVPNAKLIYLVRDPIERTRSHVVHEMRHGREHRDLAQAIEANSLYVDASRYAMQAQKWLEHYPRESLLLVQTERLHEDFEATMREVYEFLGVDPQFAPQANVLNESAQALRSSPLSQQLRLTSGVRRLVELTPAPVRTKVKDRIRRLEHARALRAQITPELRLRLAEELRPDVEELAKLMTGGFNGWGLLSGIPKPRAGADVSGKSAAFSS